MLERLFIQSYKIFSDFTVNQLGAVNLISGKNNTGKSTLLEAIRIVESEADESVLSNILLKRGAFDIAISDVTLISYLFNHKYFEHPQVRKNPEYEFTINDLKVRSTLSEDKKRVNELSIINLREQYAMQDSLRRVIPWQHISRIGAERPQDTAVYLPLAMETDAMIKHWDAISLTPYERDVVEILRIIEPRVDMVRVDGGGTKVLLKGETQPRPLLSLGDGMNRILTLALALVNARKRILLIDEFELGLHHSIQQQLWEIIFDRARQWNIQVFATTHSLDTVRAFSAVAARNEFVGLGRYFRLEVTSSGKVKAVAYDEQELDIAVENLIETR